MGMLSKCGKIMNSFNDMVADLDRALFVGTILRSQRNRPFEDSSHNKPSMDDQEKWQQISEDQSAFRWHMHLNLSQDIGPMNATIQMIQKSREYKGQCLLSNDR
jgi:hypothetical protein